MYNFDVYTEYYIFQLERRDLLLRAFNEMCINDRKAIV